jgi:hypothetical protein
MLTMQRLAGNAAIGALLAGERAAPTVQRLPDDVRTMDISPEWTRALSDEDVAEQLGIAREHLAGLTEDDPTRSSAETNLKLLEAEVRRRTAAETLASLKLGPLTGRPSGLPADDGYALVELPDLPAEALDLVPEGAVTKVALPRLYGAPAADAPAPAAPDETTAQAAETLGAGAGGATIASGVNMTTWGFPGGNQGGYSVGIVVTPRSGSMNWGHTALTIRRGGVPLEVVGFKPDMQTVRGLADIATQASEVEQGTAAVRGRFTSDLSMFRSSDAIHLEYPVSEAQAAEFAMTKPGLAPELDYTGRPAVYQPAPGACAGSNCGLWAIGELEAQTGGVVGRAGDPAGITSMGPGGSVAPGRASQPAIVEMLRGGLEDPATIRPLTPGGAAPIVSGMPYTVQVLRVGSNVLLVVGVTGGVYEIATATPEERARTTVGVGGGFAGGFLLGATAGLICGPGAPVCSFAVGLGMGTVGALGGRAVAEAIFDEATSDGGGSSRVYRNTADMWELLFVPPPRTSPEIFLDVYAQTPYVRSATTMDMAFAGPLESAEP